MEDIDKLVPKFIQQLLYLTVKDDFRGFPEPKLPVGKSNVLFEMNS